MDLFPDDPQGHLVEIVPQCIVQSTEFRPQNLVDKGLWRLEHYCGVALAVQTIGFEPIAPAQGEKELPAPLVAKRELGFHDGVAFGDVSKVRTNTFERGLCGKFLPRRSRAGEQGFDLLQLFSQQGIAAHLVLLIPSCGRHRAIGLTPPGHSTS